MNKSRRNRGLARAGTALIGMGTVQAGGALYLCMGGGVDGILSPVAAVAAAWPVAALLCFLGGRLRQTA